MKAINLFIQTRVGEASFKEAYQALSQSDDSVKPHEYSDILAVTEHLLVAGADLVDLEGFWYSYRIPHISKEFDLLKIEQGRQILNIELKCQDIGEERVKKQLVQNRSYLKHLETPVESFTYVSEIDRLYRLVPTKNQTITSSEGMSTNRSDTVSNEMQLNRTESEEYELREASFTEIVEILRGFGNQQITENLDDYFKPNNFLVSPLTQPDKLLRGEYFLTDQQERFKIEILEDIGRCVRKNRKTNDISETPPPTPQIYGITGEPGTGKTLLLYDIALTLAKQGRCCMIHGAALSEGHLYIHEHCENLDILSPKGVTAEALEAYDYIFVDEMQRIYLDLSDRILSFLSRKPIIVSFDKEQILSAEEEKRAITERVKMLAIYRPYQLTNSLRINRQIAAFYKLMFDWKETPRGVVDFSDIDILYAENESDADRMIALYTEHKDYRFLYCTCPSDTRSFLRHGVETHRVIGQEYARVMTIIDEHFYYDKNGLMSAVPHENGTYDYVRMLYQNVTRTRERLCILVYRNPEIYRELLAMKNRRWGV